MGFTPYYETIILILLIHTLSCFVRPRQDKTSRIKQKYRFSGSLVPRPLNFMVLYYCTPKARTKVS